MSIMSCWAGSGR